MKTWSTLAWCGFLLFGAGGSAQAQTSHSSLDAKVTTSAFLITYGTTFFVQVYDARTTIRALRAGAREANPLLAPVTSPAGLVAVSLARATAINVAVHSIGRRHPTAAIVIGAVMNYSYLAIAAHNNTVANRTRAQQATAR